MQEENPELSSSEVLPLAPKSSYLSGSFSQLSLRGRGNLRPLGLERPRSHGLPRKEQGSLTSDLVQEPPLLELLSGGAEEEDSGEMGGWR